MAKFASIITLLFAALALSYVYAEASALRGGKRCEKRNSSTSFSGVCQYDNACMNQCINLEGAQDGKCNNAVPTPKCICYFPCFPNS
ncbi:hypothetical protein F2Q68_00009125 [Brassica cretica]|uniref:Knottins-like domain-containing protein n=1 Tax=Brassica cretica TaxID=69181 RepID=A0A8S9KW33_BRACR|nr:hypothetical protein F2Q68_00009125 [Brassica cretica]